LLNNGTLLYDMLWHYQKSIDMNIKRGFCLFHVLDQKFYQVLLNYGKFLKNMLWHYMYELFKDINIDSHLRNFHV